MFSSGGMSVPGLTLPFMIKSCMMKIESEGLTPRRIRAPKALKWTRMEPSWMVPTLACSDYFCCILQNSDCIGGSPSLWVVPETQAPSVSNPPLKFLLNIKNCLVVLHFQAALTSPVSMWMTWLVSSRIFLSFFSCFITKGEGFIVWLQLLFNTPGTREVTPSSDVLFITS